MDTITKEPSALERSTANKTRYIDELEAIKNEYKGHAQRLAATLEQLLTSQDYDDPVSNQAREVLEQWNDGKW